MRFVNQKLVEAGRGRQIDLQLAAGRLTIVPGGVERGDRCAELNVPAFETAPTIVGTPDAFTFSVAPLAIVSGSLKNEVYVFKLSVTFPPDTVTLCVASLRSRLTVYVDAAR